MHNTQCKTTYFLLGEFSCVQLQAAGSSACRVYERVCCKMAPCHTVRSRTSPSWYAGAVLSRSDFPFKQHTPQTATATRHRPTDITATLQNKGPGPPRCSSIDPSKNLGFWLSLGLTLQSGFRLGLGLCLGLPASADFMSEDPQPQTLTPVLSKHVCLELTICIMQQFSLFNL